GLEEAGGDQMRVDQADAPGIEGVSLDHRAYLFESRDAQLRQKVQPGKRPHAVPERPQGQFRNDKRMDHDVLHQELTPHFRVLRAEMVNPDCCVRQNHGYSTRRRGISSKSGIVPPSAASLRALSRSIRDLRASRMRAVFSATPVYSWAVRTSSSSSVMVVLINPP